MDSLTHVSPIALRGLLRRRRHHLALVISTLALGAMIAVHHGPGAMADVHHAMSSGAVMEMCLGVFAAVGGAVVAVALGTLELGRWRPSFLLAPTILVAARAPEPRGRDGPALLALLCICRR